MTIALPVTNKEPFTMIPNKCFGHIKFDNVYQEIVYMALKKFADVNNQCFPGLNKIAEATLISKRKVQNTLKELKNNYLINIEERFTENGSRTSNLYTIYELPCNTVNVKNVSITTTVENTENTENTENIENTESIETVKTVETAESIETIENTENVAMTKNADNANNETETAKTIEQYKEFISRMEADGFIVLKKDDVPVELQDKSVLKSLPEMVSNDTIIAQDELVEENQVTEMEEKIETISEDIAVQEEESVLNNVAMPKNENPTIGKKIVSKLKNITRKEKKSTSAKTKVTDVENKKLSSNDDNTTHDDNTTQTAKSQPLETYSLEWLKEHFCYNAIIDKLIDKYPDAQEKIDIVFNILYTNVNATNKRTRIHGDEKPPMVIKSQFLKLNSEDIIYAIEKFSQQTTKIKNPVGYLTTLLFNAHQQRCLELENLKQHEKAKKNGKSTEPQPYQKKWQPKPNQFHQFMQREVTKEELDKLERALLGNLRFNDDDNIITEETTQTKTEMELGELERALLGNLHFKDDDNISAEEKKKKETDELERALLRKSMSWTPE